MPYDNNWRSLFFILVPRVMHPDSTLPFECTPTFVLLFASHLAPSGLFNLSNSHFPRNYKITQEHLNLSFRRYKLCTLVTLWHASAGFWHLQVTPMSFIKCFHNDFQCGFNSLPYLCIFPSSLFSFWLLHSLLAGCWCCLRVFDICCCPGVGLSDVRFWVCRHFLVQS